MASPKLLHVIISIIQLFNFFECTYAPQYSSNNSEFSNERNQTVLHQFVSVVDGDTIVFRVINGWPARLGDVPYQIALMSKVSFFRYRATCGGAIIGPNKILTAAHCIIHNEKTRSNCRKGRLSPFDFNKRRAVAGQLRSEATYGLQGQWRKITRGRYHHKYKFPKNDIAVLFTDKDFTYNSDVQPIAFASQNRDYHLKCTASGYGRIDEDYQSPVLLVATLATLKRKSCNKIHRKNFDHFVCTSDRISDVHKGDSGGPLVCRHTLDPAENEGGLLIGVVSGRDMSKHMGTFFTRVSQYYKFVNGASRVEVSLYFLLCFILIYQ